ncbi:2519_t:CDS:2, partial [Paraglomus occultum]
PLKKREGEEEATSRKRRILELNSLPSPSEYSRPGIKSCANIDLIYHHRPQGRSDIPIQFYHEIFEEFLALLNAQDTDNEVVRYKALVEQLVPPLSEFLDNEHQRMELIRNFFSFLGIHLHPLGLYNMATDGTILKSTSSKGSFMLCNFEGKTDFGTGSCAYFQNACYYAKYLGDLLKGREDMCSHACFPSFLVILEGMNISVCGGILSEYPCIDKLTAVIPLDRAGYDYNTAVEAARMFQALKVCLDNLDKYYDKVISDETIMPRISN